MSDAALAPQANDQMPAIVRVGKLTESQKDIWTFQSLAAQLPIQQFAYRLSIEGDLDAEALASALAAVVAVHEPLRTIYPLRAGRPHAAVLEARASSQGLEICEMSDAVSAERLFTEIATAPYDLAGAPPMRAVLMRRGHRFHELVLGLHHLCADAWTLKILGRQISHAYAAIRRRENPALTKPSMQAIDYAEWEAAWLRSAQCRRALAWWEQNLGEGDLAAIARTRYRAARLPIPYLRIAVLNDIVPSKLAAALDVRARLSRVPLFAVVLAALKFGLLKLTRCTDVTLATVTACRRMQNLTTAGAFRNIVVMRSRLDAPRTVQDVVSLVAKATFAALEHQWVPYRLVRRALKSTLHFDFVDLLRITFEWSDSQVDLDVQLEGTTLVQELSWDRYHYFSAGRQATVGRRWVLRSAADLQVLGAKLGTKGIELRYLYKSDLLDRDFVVALRAMTWRFLRAFAHKPHARLQTL